MAVDIKAVKMMNIKNPGNGGWAAIICTDNEVKKISGSEKDTTNNRMELMATINALKQVLRLII